MLSHNLKPGARTMKKAKPFKPGEMSLSDVLKKLGYTHGKTEDPPRGELYAHAIKRDGAIVFTGTAGAVWTWLRATGQILVLLVVFAACTATDRVASYETCCLTDDAYSCVLDELAPGETITLATCDVSATREKISRWDLAMELAAIACDGDVRWYCAPELARELCPSKLDPYCTALVDDWRALEACRADSVLGQPVSNTCKELF